MKVHTFTAAGTPVPTSLADDDDGAPPTLPGARVTKVGGDGEIVAVEPSANDVEQARAAAARIAAKQAEVTASKEDTAELRKFCLEVAAKGGNPNPADIIRAAKEFRDFVLKGD